MSIRQSLIRLLLAFGLLFVGPGYLSAQEGLVEEDAFAMPSLTLKAFGDINYVIESDDAIDDDANEFALGSLDVFLNGDLGNNVSVLSEITFDFESDQNENEVTVHRLYVQKEFSDLFKLMVGRYHAWVGYWNITYHHGTWFQTTVGRPAVQSRDILPFHSVGLTLSGTYSTDDLDLDYALAIANGRDEKRGDTANVEDKNDNKAFNGYIAVSPDAVPGLEIGFHIYIDDIPADRREAMFDEAGSPVPNPRAGEIKELIIGGYIAYFRNNVELIAELSQITHDDEVSGEEFDTLGFYIQAGYQLGEFKPYYRFDALDFDKGDPFYTGIDDDFEEHSFGLRWDTSAWSALKFEYQRRDRDEKKDRDKFVAQAAFTF
ncbi:MAG: hypothetical protein AAF492_01420 [Verrucomicrobiota bacterium]